MGSVRLPMGQVWAEPMSGEDPSALGPAPHVACAGGTGENVDVPHAPRADRNAGALQNWSRSLGTAWHEHALPTREVNLAATQCWCVLR